MKSIHINEVISYTCGVVNLHLGEQLSVDAEVTELASLIADDTVAFTRDRYEPRERTVIGTLQSPEEIPGDGVHQTRTLC